MFNAPAFGFRRFSPFLAAIMLFLAARSFAAELEAVRISPDKKSFVLEKSGAKFTPWGFNYDHDEDGRLIEDYWEKEWPKVAEDFREMKELDRKSTRLNSSHSQISYAVFCLKKKTITYDSVVGRAGNL